LQVDLGDADAVAAMIAQAQPAAVVHLAAYTDVDGCEADPGRAFRDNAIACRHLAVALPAHVRLVMVSSDQVYPDRPGAHVEGEEAPVNAYGRSKLAGEWAAQLHRNTCVLRTNIFGASRTKGRVSLSDFMVNAFSKSLAVNLFQDVYFSPLHMTTVADLIMRMINHTATGVFNAGCREGVTKAEFGLRIAREMGATTKNATLTRSIDITARAPRPCDLRLDTRRISSALDIKMPTLDEEIKKLKLSEKVQ